MDSPEVVFGESQFDARVMPVHLRWNHCAADSDNAKARIWVFAGTVELKRQCPRRNRGPHELRDVGRGSMTVRDRVGESERGGFRQWFDDERLVEPVEGTRPSRSQGSELDVRRGAGTDQGWRR